MTAQERLLQSVLWREQALFRVAVAIEALSQAIDGMPVSVERVLAARALVELEKARRACESDLGVARRHLNETEAHDVQ